MVEDGPNPVTPQGLAQIDGHIARIESAMQGEDNALLRETLARDLRYWTIRKASAESASPAGDGTVGFGSTVTIRRKGREQKFRIVGDDEADAAQGLISFRAPLAQAVLGARAGEIVETDGALGEIEIASASQHSGKTS
jgi:transcription elongation GreA/GreB family factor